MMYPNYMECYRGSPIRFLEIGIKMGASLRMWDEYFEHEGTKLFAVDIDADTLECVPRTSRWTGMRGDQSDSEFLTSLGEQHGPFDIIVEDGCHDPTHQKACFEGLWPFVKKGGVYVIEDIYHSYTGEYADDVSLQPFLQEMVDTLIPAGKSRQRPDYDYIHFYRNMVVIGKKMRA